MSYREADVQMIAEYLNVLKEGDVSTAILLGAGMSVSAGIPTAEGIMRIIEEKMPLQTLQCPEKTYQAYLKLLPQGVRKDLIGKLIDEAKINYAHLYLGALVKEGYAETILTTNFDNLAARSMAFHNIFPAIYDLGSVNEFILGGASNPALFYLHGQKDGLILLSTPENVIQHAKRIKPVFEDMAKKKCWIVVGYSGENDPVFERLVESQSFEYNLYWVGYNENEPSKHVQEKILCRDNTYFVKGYDADSFFQEIAVALKIPKPKIIDKPFSYLEESIEMIEVSEKDDKSTAEIKEVKKWIEDAQEKFPQRTENNQNNAAKVVEPQQNNFAVWNNLGADYGNQGNHEKAIKCFEKAIELKPIDPEIWYNLGAAYDNQDNHKKAIECYEQAIVLNPDYFAAWNSMGEAYGSQDKHEKAIECFVKAKELRPDDSEVWNNMGAAYGNQENFAKAIECFTKALELKPDYFEAWNNVGAVYGNQNNHAEAIACFAKAIELKVDYFAAWNNMGEAYANLGKYEKAIECYEKAIELKPDYFDAWNNLGPAYGKQGNHEKMMECYEKAIELQPEHFTAWDDMEVQYDDKKDYH